MKKLILIGLIVMALTIPASATDLTAPSVPGEAADLIQENQRSFSQDLWLLIRSALEIVEPEIPRCCGICLSLIGVSLLMSVIQCFPGRTSMVTGLCGSVAIGCLLLNSATDMIQSAAQTVTTISEYGKLLLPVLTAAMASQGSFSESAALYVGTALFDTLLTSVIAKALIPLVYIFVALSVAKGAIGQDILKRLQKFIQSASGWFLKMILYIFTGYMTITKVITGTADQTALKATKLTISGMVPVVGGILSDASETVLVSAGLVKNSIGIYGLLAVLAIAIGPFLKIGIQYLLLKLTAAICGVFGEKRSTELIEDFSKAMGLVLAMTGAVCLLQLISIVCFMKGVS